MTHCTSHPDSDLQQWDEDDELEQEDELDEDEHEGVSLEVQEEGGQGRQGHSKDEEDELQGGV